MRRSETQSHKNDKLFYNPTDFTDQNPITGKTYPTSKVGTENYLGPRFQGIVLFESPSDWSLTDCQVMWLSVAFRRIYFVVSKIIQ